MLALLDQNGVRETLSPMAVQRICGSVGDDGALDQYLLHELHDNEIVGILLRRLLPRNQISKPDTLIDRPQRFWLKSPANPKRVSGLLIVKLGRSSFPQAPKLFDFHSSPLLTKIGFAYSHAAKSMTPWGWEQWDVGIPCWFLVMATALFPPLRLKRLRGRRNRDRIVGCRPFCGYQRAASAGRPECGTVTPNPERISS
ncbi:MAG TPA: hypothetical protein VMD30_10455 [Tepidisphaeraceae bacterium]|nr:hypothetical protein [Tepidisphaeraceae bacterium]